MRTALTLTLTLFYPLYDPEIRSPHFTEGRVAEYHRRREQLVVYVAVISGDSSRRQATVTGSRRRLRLAGRRWPFHLATPTNEKLISPRPVRTNQRRNTLQLTNAAPPINVFCG